MNNLLLIQVGNLSSTDILLLLSDYLTIGIGLIIAYIAYQGYSRNNSRPMLYIAVGFVLTFGGPGVIFLASLVIPLPSLVVGVATRLVEILGMGTILYGFIVPSQRFA
ncbi:hypothetical protein [Halorubrum sp. AJ67]|uniref:DUF7521 family protein n=1 Tax=Halorubrum sp. AJ67 TaxID=1173487 RepID=UPI0003DDCE23|nr:hypothetical protein [Halorubrum sp. AJ67]CDK39154.1 uncharacterized protein BN903_137 [Halorubrum sp. AJ67]